MLVSHSRIALAALLLSLGAGATAAPVPAERAKNEKALAETRTKLHGEWVGGPCEGRILFRADGTYEWNQRGPDGHRETGKWAVAGEASEPVLTWMPARGGAQDDDTGGRVREAKIVHLDQSDLIFKYPDQPTPLNYERVKPAQQPRE